MWFSFLGLVLSVLLTPVMAVGQETCFRMEDPKGDDFGPGTYLYPKNEVFAPYHGHFDLVCFSVSTDEQEVYFEATMARLENPWRAPEGFSHQVIAVYICRGKNGRTEPPVPGIGANFAPDYPWDVRLKAAPWEMSELLVLDPAGQPHRYPLRVGLAGPRTIRMTVPLSLLGRPEPTWGYYVLVGSFDGFAGDNFRPVMAKAGEWHFGGGRDDAWDPNIIDLLAPPHGRFEQRRQLGSFDPGQGRHAVLYPVGLARRPGGPIPWPLVILLTLMLITGWILWYAPAAWRQRIEEEGKRLVSFFVSPRKKKRSSLRS